MNNRRFLSVLLDFEADNTFPQTVTVGNYKILKLTEKLRNEILDRAVYSLSKVDKTRFSKASHVIEYRYRSDDYSKEALSTIFSDVQSVINVFRMMKPSNAVGFGVDLTYTKRKISKALFLEPDQKKMYSASYIPESYIFNAEDSRYINKLYVAYESVINKTGYSRISTAYYFYANYFQLSPANARPKVVSLVAAIEALFNTGVGDSAYKVSMRIASFISSNSSRRKNVYDHVKYIYKVRSNIVHGQSLGKTVYGDDSNISVNIYHVEAYLRVVFQLIAANKLQDVFALSNEELDVKFDDLLLGVKTKLN